MMSGDGLTLATMRTGEDFLVVRKIGLARLQTVVYIKTCVCLLCQRDRELAPNAPRGCGWLARPVATRPVSGCPVFNTPRPSYWWRTDAPILQQTDLGSEIAIRHNQYDYIT